MTSRSRQTAAELDTSTSFATDLADAGTVDVAVTLLAHLAELLDAQLGAVYVRDRAGDPLRPVAAFGSPADLPDALDAAAVPVTRPIVRVRGPHAPLCDPTVRRALHIPLWSAGALVGIVSLGRRDAGGLARADWSLAANLAAQAATALGYTIAAERQERRAQMPQSEELLTALTVISGYGELLLQLGSELHPEHRRWVQCIVDAAERLDEAIAQTRRDSAAGA